MIPERIIDMLSGGQEMRGLGLTLLREYSPAAWACLCNYTGWGNGPVGEVLEEMHKNKYTNIGDIVRYRGMPESPNMVITNIVLRPTPPSGSTYSPNPRTFSESFYHTDVTVRYWNKSKQELNSVTDRLECFEIVNLKNKV